MMTRKNSGCGLTRVEVLALILIPAFLFLFVLPCTMVSLGNAQRRAQRISCMNNLKQVGLSMRLFSNEHDSRFPWMISTNAGGSLEFSNSSKTFLHFLAASNELVTPRVLTCPLDSKRARASVFSELSNTNLSYFLSFDAKLETNASPSILSGDRNVLGGTPINGALRLVRKSDKLSWSKEIHQKAGNVALVDGSVMQADDVGLNNLVGRMTNSSIRLAIP